jgi:hypothetical protein
MKYAFVCRLYCYLLVLLHVGIYTGHECRLKYWKTIPTNHQTSDYIAIHCRYLLLDKFNTLLLLCELKRALYGIKCVLRIF